MKSIRLILFGTFLGVSLVLAQDEPAAVDPTENEEPATAAAPIAEETPAEEEASSETADSASPESSGSPGDAETPMEPPSSDSGETPTEIAPETTAADLPIGDESTSDISIADGPDELTPPPDTTFIEPTTGLGFDEFEAPPDASTLPPPPRNIAEEERKERLRYQKVRVQALKDPAVVKALETAEKAKTLEDYRAHFRLYYKLLYAKIAELDPTLEEYCKTMENAHLRRLAQSQILPTIPNKPPPR